MLAHDTISGNALFLSFLVMWSLYPFILGQASPAVFCQKLVAKGGGPSVKNEGVCFTHGRVWPQKGGDACEIGNG